MSPVAGQFTYTEIQSQPTVWQDTLTTFDYYREQVTAEWARLQPRRVLFTGCGSTYYLSQIAAPLFQSMTGIESRACPASELLLFPGNLLTDPAHTLLITVSRSGTTSETLLAAERFRKLGGASIWAISCYAESNLVQLADLAMVADSAYERSVAQTRSFSSMLLLIEAMAATISRADLTPMSHLPSAAATLLTESASLMQALGNQLEMNQFFFLGSGTQYGVASEIMLKMKEMSISHSEAYHFMEFRHGPKSLVNSQSLVIGLCSESAYSHETQVLAEMAELGATTLALSPAAIASAHHTLALPDTLPVWALPVLYLPPLQLLAYHRSIAKGLDPDNPRHLEAVVYLDTAVFH